MADHTDIPGVLAEAGLRITEGSGTADVLIPPGVAAQAVDYPLGEGRVDALTDIDDPLVCEKANADWYRLSVEQRLFDEASRRFFLAVRFEAGKAPEWVQAELTDPWDIMGRGAASGVLGSRYCRPEFVMLSYDGSVICCGTTWQYAIGTVVVKDQQRSQFLQNRARAMAESPYRTPEEREPIVRWLASI